MAQILLELSEIISKATKTIHDRCISQSKQFPRLNEPFDQALESIRLDNEISEATVQLVSAAYQLISTVRTPETTLIDVASGSILSSALRVASVSAVAEIVSESSGKGIHVSEIAKVNHYDSVKLSRILRTLATNHIFTEISPDVFGHNLLSSLLDTGKSSREVFSNPLEKYNDAKGYSAIVEWSTDEVSKGATYLVEHLQDSDSGQSGEPTNTAINRAMNHHLNLYDWYGQPGNELRFTRFFKGMESGGKRFLPPDDVLKGFEWESLPFGSTIVDVGGGTGSVALEIAKAHPTFKFVIQDRESVLKSAREYWHEHLPDAVNSERVSFQEHDFYERQPSENDAVAVFLMRFILPDYSDKYCLQILGRLRESATPTTRIVFIGYIVPYACRLPPSSPISSINGAANLTPNSNESSPLLANYGKSNSRLYSVDLQLMMLFNGHSRTLGQYSDLFEAAGWKIEKVYRVESAAQQQIVATPIIR